MRHFLTFKGIDSGNDIRLDVSAICNSENTRTLDGRCTRDFTSSAGSASFVIGYTPDKVLDPYDGTLIDRKTLYENAVQYILTCIETKAEIQAEILDDTRTNVVFTGTVDPSDIDLLRQKIPSSINLSLKDYTTDLDKKIGRNIVYRNKSINEIVNGFLSEIYGNGAHTFVGNGISHTDSYDAISSLPDSKTVDYFVVTEDDDVTYRKKMDGLLQEAPGYVLHYIHSTNRFEVVKAIPDEVDDSQIETVAYKTAEGISLRTGVYAHDGILLKWPTVTVKENDNVYSEGIDLKYDSDGNTLGKVLGNGDYYPTDGDITETRQSFRKGDYDYATGASRKQNKDLGLLFAEDTQLIIIDEQVRMRSRGTVADMDALAALSNPKLGDYAYVTSESEYRAYDGSAWIYTETPSVDSDGKGNVYHDKGEVTTYASLPSIADTGDFYKCLDTGFYWCRMDSEWQRKIGLFLFPVLETSDVDMVDGNPAFYPRSMWVLGRNRSGGLVNLQVLSATATSVAKTKENRTTYPLIIKDPEEYTASYIFDSTDAEAFALWLYNAHRIACTTVTWYEWEDQRVAKSSLGDRVKVEFVPGKKAVFCVIQIENEPVTRLKRKYKVTALLVSGFESAFSGKHTAEVYPSDAQRTIVNTVETYAVSTSGTIRPSVWMENRVIEQGKYLWTRTITYWSDGTQDTAYSVVYNAKDGEDASAEGLTTEIEYGLSTSPSEFIFPPAEYGYQNGADTDTLGYSDDDDDAYGFYDVAEWSTTYSQWYKGLYVWIRTKTTDRNGNVSYGEPEYCEEITQSLWEGSLLEVVAVSPTWVKNLAATEVTTTVTFRIKATNYQNYNALLNAISSITVTPFKNDNAADEPIVIAKNSYSSVSGLTLTYTYSFPKSTDWDSLVFTVTAAGFRTGETVIVEATMTAQNITRIDEFGGMFATSAEAEAWFEEECEGLMEGYTYGVYDPESAENLSLKTWRSGQWVNLSTQSGFSPSRISSICSKAQRSVLALVEEGSVTATDYGYFNLVIADIVTAAFIGSKQIELQPDENGNPGMIYGGDVTPSNTSGNRVGSKGFYFDSNGDAEVSDLKVKGNSEIGGNSTIRGQVINTNETDGKPVFQTFKDDSKGYSFAASRSEASNVPNAFKYSEWESYLTTQGNALTAGTLYSASGTISVRQGRSVVQKTLAYIKRLTSLDSTEQTLFNVYSSNTSEYDVIKDNFWTNNYGKAIKLYMVFISPQYSVNMFHAHDYGDTQIKVLNADGTVYHDYGVNDDTSGTYYNVYVPAGGRIWAYWGKATKYSYSRQPGYIQGTYIESDNWSVGINYCFSDGTSKLLSSTIPSSYGTSAQSYSCNGVSASITFALGATWPNGVYKYFNQLVWTTSPQDGDGNPPTGEISASIFDHATFTYGGVSVAVARVRFSTTTLVVEGANGVIYPLTSGNYARQYSIDVETLGEILGARARNMMPIYENGSIVGGGAVGSSDEPWTSVTARAVHDLSRRDSKDDIQPFAKNALDILRNVLISTFYYKADRDNPDKYRHIGFIADDTPEELTTPKHDVMDIGACIGVLIKAIQELASEIDRLKGGNS